MLGRLLIPEISNPAKFKATRSRQEPNRVAAQPSRIDYNVPAINFVAASRMLSKTSSVGLSFTTGKVCKRNMVSMRLFMQTMTRNGSSGFERLGPEK